MNEKISMLKKANMLDRQGRHKEADSLEKKAYTDEPVGGLNRYNVQPLTETKPAKNSLLGPAMDWWKARKQRRATDRGTADLSRQWKGYSEDMDAIIGRRNYDPREQILDRLQKSQNGPYASEGVPYTKPFSGRELDAYRDFYDSSHNAYEAGRYLNDSSLYSNKPWASSRYQRMKSVLDDSLRDRRDLPKRPPVGKRGHDEVADMYEDRLKKQIK